MGTLGGGACVYPTFLDRNYSGSYNKVVEIDPAVIRIAQEYFDVPLDPKVSIADARGYVNTVQEVFSYVAVYIPSDTSFDQRSTFVVAASREALRMDLLRDVHGEVVAKRVAASQMRDLAARNGSVRLTDDYAPVENFIAPVFLKSVH